MLLYHSSGWVHHDFRSHNVLFLSNSEIREGESDESILHDGVRFDQPFIVGFGHARDETEDSVTFEDKKFISQTLKQQKLYWSPAYLTSSGQMRRAQSFQRSHDVYSLGCVMLEIGVWRPLEAFSWSSKYDENHSLWHTRLLQELGKLRAMCGSRYTDVVLRCLNSGGVGDVQTDVQTLAFEILLKLEEIVV
jgi:serine/threonine protein kinase